MIYLYAYVRWDMKNTDQGRFFKVLLLLYFTNQSFLKQFNFLCQTDISAAFLCEESRQCEDEATPAPEWNVFDMPECLTNEYKEINKISFKIKERVNSNIETSEPSCQKDSFIINSNYRTNLQTP